jgi:phosphopantetheinyl transferase
MNPRIVDTPCGKVFLETLPDGEHLPWVFATLSRVMGVPVGESDMVRSEEGRPDFPGFGLDVNWSHSRKMCVLAYSFDCRVGVDLEFHRPRSLQIAKRFYAKEERDWIWGCGNFETEAEKLNEFYRLWCRKEAFYKCAGGAFLGGTLSMNLLNSPIGGVFLYDFQGPFAAPHACCLAVSSQVG